MKMSVRVRAPRIAHTNLARMHGVAQNGAVQRKVITVALRAGLKAALIAGLIAGLTFLPSLSRSQPDRMNTPKPQEQAPPPEARVDINHASIEQILKVPGMTRSWAERIVRFRPYRTKQDLVDSGVMPGDVYKRIKDYIIAHQEKM